MIFFVYILIKSLLNMLQAFIFYRPDVGYVKVKRL